MEEIYTVITKKSFLDRPKFTVYSKDGRLTTIETERGDSGMIIGIGKPSAADAAIKGVPEGDLLDCKGKSICYTYQRKGKIVNTELPISTPPITKVERKKVVH